MRKLLSLFALFFLLILTNCASDSEDVKRHATLSKIFPDSSQRDILTDTKYSKLLIEVIYVSSWTTTPTRADLDYLKEKVLKYCNKDVVVTVVDPPIVYGSMPTVMWDTGLLKMFENQHSLYSTVGDTLVVHVLYLPGIYYPDIVVRGLAYGDYAFVLFRQQMTQSHERGVLLHEFGHLIGLVGCGTKCQSEHEETDPKHTPHCRNEGKCVMYYSSPDIQNPDFDAPCQEDLKANGGK